MALVTGNYVTSAGAAIPAGAQPRVEAVPSHAAVTATGQAISREPQTVTPNATTGAFSVTLIPTTDVLDAGFHYNLTGYYLKPDGYGNTGYTRHDIFTHKLHVPAEGGDIGELAVRSGGITFAGMITGFGPPSPEILAGTVPYVDVSGVDPVFYFPA